MSRTNASGNRFWVGHLGEVWEVVDGVSCLAGTLTGDELARLKATGWTVGSSTRRYAFNPLAMLRKAA